MKVKFIHLSDARGKIGGSVASKNRSGNYFRSKVSPVNPQTTAQTNVRSRFGALAQQFRGLTVAQIAQWNDAVSSWASSNIFGDSIKPTGLNLYVQLNSNIINAGGTPLLVPPAPTEMPSDLTAAVNFTVTGTVAELVISGTPIGTLSAVLRATPTISNGIGYVKNLLRQVGSYDMGAAVEFDIEANWIAKFGAFPAVGERHVCAVDIISQDTGQILRSIPTTYTVTA